MIKVLDWINCGRDVAAAVSARQKAAWLGVDAASPRPATKAGAPTNAEAKVGISNRFDAIAVGPHR